MAPMRALMLALQIGLAAAAAPVAAAAATPAPAPAQGTTSPATEQLLGWINATGDNRGLPFAIIDKPSATVTVFDAYGGRVGSSAALVGLAKGDGSTPGIGDRELSDIAPDERTTPAGRFVGAYGPGPGKSPVLWVDYGTAISLHEVVTSNPKERRLQRLRSADLADNRITFGCINVSAAFYRGVVRPTFSGTEGIFYIVPDTQSLAEAFPGFRAGYASYDRVEGLSASN